MLGAALAAEHLLRAWSSVDETTTPEQRAATLTGAIAGAANASAVSSALGALGVPVLVWMLVQRPKKP